jgi:hypothetical protein
MVAVSGLTPLSDYEFQVQTVCAAGGASVYNGSTLFTTGGFLNVVSALADDANTLTVYPNPTHGDVRIAYHLSGAQPVTIGVYDMVGKQVLSLADAAVQQQGMHEYGVSSLPAGLYFVKLKAGSATATVRLVKL